MKFGLKEKRRTIVLFCVGASLPVLSGTSLGAIYPVLKEVYNFSSFNISVIVSASMIAAIISAPLLGILADRLGLLRVVFPVLLIYALGAFTNSLTAFVSFGHLEFLVAGRIMQGIGAIGTGPLAVTIIRRLMGDHAGPGVAWIEASSSLGAVVGPVLGGLVSNWHWYFIFWIDGCTMLVCLALLALTLSAYNDNIIQKNINQSAGNKQFEHHSLSFSRLIKGSFLGGFGLMFSLAGMQIFLIDYLTTTYGFSILQSSLIVAFHALLMAGTAAISGRYLLPKRSPTMIITGLSIYTIALLCLGLRIQIEITIILLILSGIGCGMILPPGNMLILKEASPGRESQTMSLSGSFRSVGSLVGSSVAGWLSVYGYMNMFRINGIILLAIVVTTYLLFFYEKSNAFPVLKEQM